MVLTCADRHTSTAPHSFSCSVTGRLSKRNSSRLTPRVQGKAPSLHRHYPASTLLWASPTPDTAKHRLCIPYGCCGQDQLHAGSPRFLDQSFSMRRPQSPRRARQLLAPVSSLPTLGFAYPGRLATPISITRPNRIRLCYGSHFRLARLRKTGYPALRSLGYLSNRQFTR